MLSIIAVGQTFFYQFMDAIDKGDSPLVSGVLALTMALIVSVIFIRELQEPHTSENDREYRAYT